jgi:hypothetical protein
MKQASPAQLPFGPCPAPPTSQALRQGSPEPHAVAMHGSEVVPSEERALHDSTGSLLSVRKLCGYLAFKLHRLCFHQQWCVAVRPRISGPGAFDLKDFYVLKPSRDRFYADPFVVERGGRSYLFFEELIFAQRRGTINCIEFNDEGFLGSPSIVLEAKHHLSYPFLFEWEGQTYMLPESHASGRIELYRAVEFPLRWEYAGSLMDNVWAVDSTIFQHQGRFWMFSGGVKKNGKPDSELYLFHADTPLGPWIAHPHNPIVSDISRARPAGQVFSHEGVLIRPGQDSSHGYGGAIALNRIDLLTPEEYHETPIRTLGPEWFPAATGTHTLNHSQHHQTFDARIQILSPKLIAQKLWWSLCEHLTKQKV